MQSWLRIYHKRSHRQPPNHLAAYQPVTSNVEAVTNGNTIPSDQVQSRLIGSDKSIVSHMEVANDTVTDGDTVSIVSPVTTCCFPKVAKI